MTTKKKVRIGWKKVIATGGGTQREIIVKLEIRGQVVENGIQHGQKSNKCRTSLAKVLKIYGLRKGEKAVSMHSFSFEYKEGALVRPKYPFKKSYDACGSGIHFFNTIKEAEDY